MFTLLVAALALVGTAVAQNATRKPVLYGDLGEFNSLLRIVRHADEWPLDIVWWKEQKKNSKLFYQFLPETTRLTRCSSSRRLLLRSDSTISPAQ